MTQPRRRRWNCCIDDVAVSTFTKRRWWPACALYPMARSRPKFAPSRRPRRTFYVCRSGWRQTSARMWQWRRPASTGSRCGRAQILDAHRVFLERGVVDQDVELAERFRGLLHRRLAEAEIGNVAPHGDAAPAFGFDGAFGLLGIGVLGQVCDRNVCALARIKDRDRAADPGIAAGDECDHVLEFARTT